MNDSMLMQATSRQSELTQEVGRARLAARLRRSRSTSRPTQTKTLTMARKNTEKKAHAGRWSRPLRPGFRLATAIARLRPGSAQGWQAQ
jgi:hypothetical protein